MGFFTRAAMDALMKTTHPEINRRQCWNLHPHRKSCTACKDICPYGDQIFTRPNLVKDWDPCTDCGLCVSACRSGCIAPSPEQVQRDTAAADSDNDTIWIGCEKSARKNSMVRACIASLSWEALAYLALNKKIVLDLTPCGQCENDLCAEQLRKELTRLVDFFGQPMFEARFSLAYEEKEYPYHVQELTRREMLEQVSHGSKSGTKKLLQMLPPALQPSYAPFVLESDPATGALVKAADKLSAHIKCIEELKAGNAEFKQAAEQTLEALQGYGLPELDYFLEHFLPAFGLTLDELQ